MCRPMSLYLRVVLINGANFASVIEGAYFRQVLLGDLFLHFTVLVVQTLKVHQRGL